MTTPWRSAHLYRSARSKRRHPREKGLRLIGPGDLIIFYLLLARRIKRHTEPFSKTRKGGWPDAERDDSVRACSQDKSDMQHVMLDLETLSVRPDAALLSVGAVRFDETGVANVEEHRHGWQFYAVIEVPTGHVDVSTVRWWLQQSEPARAAVATEIGHFWSETQVLWDFKEFFERMPDSLLWAWPTTADEVWLRNCYLRNGYVERGAAANHTLPWTHRQVRCARTVAQLLCLGKAPNSAEHNALADARAQAEQMVTALRKFRYLARHNPDGEFDEMAEVA